MNTLASQNTYTVIATNANEGYIWTSDALHENITSIIHLSSRISSLPLLRRQSIYKMLLHNTSFLICIALIHVIDAASISTPRSTQFITWTSCPNITAPNLDCGSITVPMDYNNPTNGDTVTLGMSRLSANGTSRLGCLFYNPGGPGVSAAQELIAVAEGAYLFSKDLLEHYDIIAIDPRGVGFSQPVTCDPALWNPRVNFRPHNESEFETLIAHNKAFGQSCVEKTGLLIKHLDTVHVAHDIELVRQALGEEKLNYLGQSYGTLIGTTYAELFPENIGRMVLDGITDHTISEVGFLTSAAVTLEITLEKFFEWCDSTEECALHGMDPATVWDDLIAAAQKAPIPAPGCVETGACRSDATAEEIIFMVKTALHAFEANPLFGPGWPAVSAAIAQAAQGNATLVSMPISSSETDSLFSTIAISCVDWTRNGRTSADLSLRQQASATLAPRVLGFPPVGILLNVCADWPVNVTNPNHPLDQKAVAKAPPVLLVHSLFDPATSIEWANNVRLQMPGSRLVIREGVGHSSYQLGGESAKAVDKYLIEGLMPEDGMVYQS